MELAQLYDTLARERKHNPPREADREDEAVPLPLGASHTATEKGKGFPDWQPYV